MQKFVTLFLYCVALKAIISERIPAFREEVWEILEALENVLDFVENYPGQINFDGIVCISMAQAQLEQIIVPKGELEDYIADLVNQCHQLIETILSSMVNLLSADYKLFAKYLTNSNFWHHQVAFEEGLLDDLGVYDPSTMKEIFSQFSVSYQNTSTDVCIKEIMEENEKDSGEKNCHISPKCETVVLGNRNDTAYLLTHRLFYLQIARQSNCIMDEDWMNHYIRNYCSLILKESKTSEILGFPLHDIFIEQVLFCGMEGFAEFLITDWADEILSWQTDEGCYFAEKTSSRKKRNSNIIVFGCNDHTTGLAAAALALKARHILSN